MSGPEKPKPPIMVSHSPSTFYYGTSFGMTPWLSIANTFPKCEYCGRKQKRPDDGGCVSCGAPLP